MGDDSGPVAKIKFQRHEQFFFGGDVTEWADGKFPTCPLCKKPSLWEWGSKINWVPLWERRMWGDKTPRIYFRCPNCMGVISVNVDVVRKWRLLPFSLFRHEDAKIESVGNNSGLMHLIGQKYPIKTLQEWASQTNVKKET